jgi:ribosome-associated translation inhibitor RaiA
MQTPPEIEFQGVTGTPEIQDTIEKHVAELKHRWDRITDVPSHVEGSGPASPQRRTYEVHIRVALSDGREVNVERTPPVDDRHSDLTFAINDAFKHARRQLQDQVRRARRDR